MDRLRRLLIVTFLESVSTIMVERAIYFYTSDRLGFSEYQNLWLALGIGLCYIVGALLSHRLCLAWSEKGLLLVTLVGQIVLHGLMSVVLEAPVLIGAALVVTVSYGMKWPVIESYVSAGRTPKTAAKAIGHFNISWSSAVPVALVIAGPMIEAWGAGLFAFAAGLNLVSGRLIRTLERRPVHLPEGHLERLPAGQLLRLRALLKSNRMTMISSYTLLFVLAPLMPAIFSKLGFGVKWATALSGVVDVIRLLGFVILQRYTRWHGRAAWAVLAAFCLPIGFFMIIWGNHLGTVIAGELLFGLAAGVSYYAALYYAMTLGNGSVDAGGWHETMIGMGFSLGPGLELGGRHVAPVLGHAQWATLIGLGPFSLVCLVGGLWPLRTWRHLRVEESAPSANPHPPLQASQIPSDSARTKKP